MFSIIFRNLIAWKTAHRVNRKTHIDKEKDATVIKIEVPRYFSFNIKEVL